MKSCTKKGVCCRGLTFEKPRKNLSQSIKHQRNLWSLDPPKHCQATQDTPRKAIKDPQKSKTFIFSSQTHTTPAKAQSFSPKLTQTSATRPRLFIISPPKQKLLRTCSPCTRKALGCEKHVSPKTSAKAQGHV